MRAAIVALCLMMTVGLPSPSTAQDLAPDLKALAAAEGVTDRGVNTGFFENVAWHGEAP